MSLTNSQTTMSLEAEPKPFTYAGTDCGRRVTYGVNKTLAKQATYFKLVKDQLKSGNRRAKGQAPGTVMLPDGLDVDIVQAYIAFAEQQDPTKNVVFTIAAHNAANPTAMVNPTIKTCINFYYTAYRMKLHPDLGRDLMRANILGFCTAADRLLSARDITHVVATLTHVDRDFVFQVLKDGCKKQRKGKYGTKEGKRQWAEVVTFMQDGEFGPGLTHLVESTVRVRKANGDEQEGVKTKAAAEARPASSWD